jgi:hypothetical protein
MIRRLNVYCNVEKYNIWKTVEDAKKSMRHKICLLAKEKRENKRVDLSLFH